MAGRWGAALDAVDDLDALIARREDKRFPPIAANMRGWLLRGAGQLDLAEESHCTAAETTPGPTLQEAHYAALLDLVECHLAAHDLDAAVAAIDGCQDIVDLDWMGSIAWRHRRRYQLLAARIASLSGDHVQGEKVPRPQAAAAAELGDRHYVARALLVAATIDARAGRRLELEAVGHLVDRYVPLGGPDGWRDLGELAAALRSEEIWCQAEKQAAAVVAEASGRGRVLTPTQSPGKSAANSTIQTMTSGVANPSQTREEMIGQDFTPGE